jgi:hypothetical protein
LIPGFSHGFDNGSNVEINVSQTQCRERHTNTEKAKLLASVLPTVDYLDITV